MRRYQLHKVPTDKIGVFLARPWEIINLRGLLSHNIDIVASIDGILPNFNLPKLRGRSRYIRIEPMAFEYDWIKRFATFKSELVYFFDYAVVVAVIGARRTNSGIRGSSVWATLFVSCCVKAISIHIINGK